MGWRFWRRSPGRLRLTISGLVFLVIGLVVGWLAGARSIDECAGGGCETRVHLVIDGDTLLLSDKTLVRLVGVDAPERDEPGYQEAKAFVEDRVAGKAVRLEPDPCCGLDVHGRTLGYVFVEGELLNQRLLDEGLAVPFLADQLEAGYLSF